jgi:hypothetical protein
MTSKVKGPSEVPYLFMSFHVMMNRLDSALVDSVRAGDTEV